MRISTYLLPCFVLPLVAAAEPGAPKIQKVDFRRDVLPVLSAKCFHCHGPDEHSREAKLRLDVREDALKDRDGIKPIVPGDPKLSEVMVRILSKDEEELMPPPKKDKALTPAEAEVIRQWIAQGADYEQHWSFVKPRLSAVPPLPPQTKAFNPIDHFVAAKVVDAGLMPAPEADRFTLLRRAALDLTGLPPSSEELAIYTKDTAPGAYERAVDRLLASPQFGEKWARMWLDLARYADSTGYGSDKFRMNVWPYRDWVINAFNRNMPYDQFTREQLAGDLLPNASSEQIAATAFHRNTMTQTEGGTDDEEYRVAAVKDRVATTMQVWMGLTAGCAQCHTHKFDPISQKEYYQLFAVFNQTEDADREDEAPRLPLATKAEADRRAKIAAEIAALEKKVDAAALETEQHEWEERVSRPMNWTALKPVEAKTDTHDGELQIQPDGSVLARHAAPDKDTYTLQIPGPFKGLTALSIEALTDDTLPAKGPGRSSGGNAVISGLTVRVLPAQTQVTRGRYVRIEHRPESFLHLAEVQVFQGSNNLARQGQATQSTTGYAGTPERAIDGNTNGDFEKNSVTHNAENDRSPWWEVDLGSEQAIDKITVWNRTGPDMEGRLTGAKLLILDAQRKPVLTRSITAPPQPSADYLPADGMPVELVNPTADYAQKDFPATAVLDSKNGTGWAFGGAIGEPHLLVTEFTQPVDVPAGSLLRVKIAQLYGSQHTLGKFRLNVTSEPPPIRELPKAMRAILALEPSERSPEQRTALADYFRPFSKSAAAVHQQIEAKKRELAKIKPVELPIMRELPREKRRKSYLFNKGNFLLRGEEVSPAVFASFGPAPQGEVNRLALADWILSPENPLTARVTVNRFWAQIFGTGLTETEEDFGTQGQFPTHPELLDWLAVTFSTSKAKGGLGWDTKGLIRLLVTSYTYRQSSQATDAARQKDSRNQWLSHYPRRRLEAEAIRDQALALSGLLSRKMGGPSVYPPQPDGLWNVAFNGGQNSYPTSRGDDRRRRGIYTFWRRIAPNPTMATFDAPSRETCTIRRVPTNTPLQAFVTLNDPVFVECAQSLARRIAAQPGDTNARVRWALQTTLARPASDAQIAPLRELYEAELANYRQRLENAKKLAANPELPLPAGADAADLAAWTVVANVLLNLDGVLTKS